jgi:MFS family permease
VGEVSTKDQSGVGPVAARRAPRDVYFGLLAVVVCLEAVGIGVLFPLLAHVQDAHHLPTYTLGLMSGASFFAALIAQVGAGPLLDGHRARPLLLAGVLAGAAALVWFAFAGGLGGLVGARALGGVGYGIVSPAALRQASRGSSGARRGKRLGVLSSAQMAGFVIGPLFGSVLYAAGGLRTPFEVVGGLLALTGIGVALLPDYSAARRPASGEASERAPVVVDTSAVAAAPGPVGEGRMLGPRWRELAGIPVGPLVAVLLLGAALQLPNGLYDALWSRMLTDRGASSLLIGLSLSFFGVPFVVLAPLGGKLAERRGPLLAGGLGLLAADCFMAAYGFVPWPVLIVALGVGEACVQSVAIPGGFASVGRVFPDERIAAGQGLFGGVGTVAAGTAAVVGAPLYAAFGGPAAFGGGAALSAALVAAALLVGRRSPLAAGSGEPAGGSGAPGTGVGSGEPAGGSGAPGTGGWTPGPLTPPGAAGGATPVTSDP